ncbi:MAG TPA: hypothetical protein PKU74_04705, partial [Candidatus Omnitrophota bacterium]|nr:hypothetical protein [Candidatus Omnitrophota bacterium]
SVYGFDQVDLFTVGVSETGRVFYSYHHQKLARYLKKNRFDLVLGQLMIEGACQECLGGITAAKQPAVLYALRQNIETIDNEEVTLLGKHLLYFDGQKLLRVKDSHPHVLNVYSQEAHYAEILGLETPEWNAGPRMTSGLKLSYPERVVVLFNYFSSTERKDYDYAWMNRIVAQLVIQYGHRLAVLIDSGETAAKQDIASSAWVEINRMITQHKRVHKGTGRMVIMETYQHDLQGLNKLINSADVVVTPDTYSMHAAVAMGKIVVTPWGYAINRFLRWAPSAAGYLPVMSRATDVRHANKPAVPQEILWRAVEFAVLAGLKEKGLDGTTRHERRKGDPAKRGTHPALTVEDLFKDNRVAQGRRIISNILSHRNKMEERYTQGQVNRFFHRTGWQMLAEMEELKEVLRPQYARLATYHLDTGEDIWAKRFALALSGNDADLAQDLLKVSPTVRVAEFINAYFIIPEGEAGSSSSPIEEQDAVWDHIWTQEEHEIISRSFVKVLRDTYGPQVLLEQTRTYAVEDVLGPLTEEVALEFARRNSANTLPEALIRREGKDVSSPIEESDGYTVSEKIRQVRQAQAAGLARMAEASEAGYIALHVEEAFLFLEEENGLPDTRGPPAVVLMDSARVTFGVYYNPAVNVLYVESAVMDNASCHFTRLLVRELKAGSERDKISAAARYQYSAFVEFNDEFLNRYVRSLVSREDDALAVVEMIGYARKVTLQLEKMLWKKARVLPLETLSPAQEEAGLLGQADIVVYNLDKEEDMTAERLAARVLPLTKHGSVLLAHSDAVIMRMQVENEQLAVRDLTMNVEIERYRSANGSLVKPTFYIHKHSARTIKIFHRAGLFVRFRRIQDFLAASRGLASFVPRIQALEEMFNEKFDTVTDALALMEAKQKAAFEQYRHTRTIMPGVKEEIARTRREAREALRETFFFNPDALLAERVVDGLNAAGYEARHRQGEYQTVHDRTARENAVRLKLPGALIAAEKPVVPSGNETVPAEIMDEPLSRPAEAVAGAGEERAAESEELTAAKALKAGVEDALKTAREDVLKAADRLEKLDAPSWQDQVAVMRRYFEDIRALEPAARAGKILRLRYDTELKPYRLSALPFLIRTVLSEEPENVIHKATEVLLMTWYVLSPDRDPAFQGIHNLMNAVVLITIVEDLLQASRADLRAMWAGTGMNMKPENKKYFSYTGSELPKLAAVFSDRSPYFRLAQLTHTLVKKYNDQPVWEAGQTPQRASS